MEIYLRRMSEENSYTITIIIKNFYVKYKMIKIFNIKTIILYNILSFSVHIKSESIRFNLM